MENPRAGRFCFLLWLLVAARRARLYHESSVASSIMTSAAGGIEPARSMRPWPQEGQRGAVESASLSGTLGSVSGTPRSRRQSVSFSRRHRFAQEAEMADPHEALGQGVLQEAPDELDGVQRHDPCFPAATVVFPPERDLTIAQRHQPSVRNRHPMGVPGQVLQHRLRPRERPLGVDHPRLLPDLTDQPPEPTRPLEMGQPALKLEPTQVEGLLQAFEKFAAEHRRRHPDGREEALRAGDPPCSARRSPAPRNHAVHVWMVVQILPPRVQHRQEPDLGAEVLQVGSDLLERLARRLEQERAEHPLVLQSDGPPARRGG